MTIAEKTPLKSAEAAETVDFSKLTEPPEFEPLLAEIKARRDELIIQWLYRAEGRKAAREKGVTEEEIRAFYDDNQDMFTREDGGVASFDLVRDSIHGALFTNLENNAMDALISRLKEERRADVEVYLAGLRRAKLERPTPVKMPGQE